MSKLHKILLILACVFIIIAIAIFFSMDKTTRTFNTIREGQNIKEGTKVVVSGVLEHRQDGCYDEEYQVILSAPIVKKIKSIKSVDTSSGWKDEEPVCITSDWYMNKIKISGDIIDELGEYQPINKSEEIGIQNLGLQVTKSNDEDIVYVSTMAEEELRTWRVRYYKKEIDVKKTYTIIGKWDGKQISKIDGMEKSVYEGNLLPNKTKQVIMYSSIVLGGICVLLSVGIYFKNRVKKDE